jgi:hypothetical protein
MRSCCGKCPLYYLWNMAERPNPVFRTLEKVVPLIGKMAIYDSQVEASQRIPHQRREFRSTHPALGSSSEVYGASPCNGSASEFCQVSATSKSSVSLRALHQSGYIHCDGHLFANPLRPGADGSSTLSDYSFFDHPRVVSGRPTMETMAPQRIYVRCRWVSLNTVGYFSPYPNARSRPIWASQMSASARPRDRCRANEHATRAAGKSSV